MTPAGTTTRIDHPARAAGARLVAIVGGGFGGLSAARRLARCPGVHVVLIDGRNHHLFQPLLYQVATAGLNPADIAVPIRAQFRDAPNVEVHLGQVDRVDLDAGLVCGEGYALAYDYLILACGVTHSYFGRPDWEEFAPGLKSLEQATEIRRRILTAFERAENTLDADEQQRQLTFVVVGGGPTGVELAGAIADISRTVLRGDFRRVDPGQARIVLVEAGPRVLPTLPEALSRRAARDLAALGVDVRTGVPVADIDTDGVVCGTERIPSRTVLWAAGVGAAGPDLGPGVTRDRAGRVQVGPDGSVPGHPRVFVIGDMASMAGPDGRPVPGVAPAAMQAGRHAAETLLRDLGGRPRQPFVYRDKGQMATIGRSRAVAALGQVRLAGRVAWLAWLFVHVVQLVGFRNRLAVLAQWTWNYVFSRRDSRLITGRAWKLHA